MPHMTETAAEKLSPQQATALVKVLDLQARWENHRDDPQKSAGAVGDLQTRQRAFEAFRAGLREYTAAYHDAQLPEPTQNVPDRFALWCRTLRTVLNRAEAGTPAAVLAKVYRLADRVAVRAAKSPVAPVVAADLPGAVRALDEVVLWCLAPADRPQVEAA